MRNGLGGELAAEFSKDRYLAYHADQLTTPKRSTIHLSRFVRETLGDTASEMQDVLDVACGAGANMLHLHPVLPSAHWTGIDIVPKYFSLGRDKMNHGPFSFIAGDMFRLDHLFKEQTFDVTFCIQTLLALPDYEEAIRNILAVTSKWVFITSLMWDHRFDATIELDLRDRADKSEETVTTYHNVYSFPRFADFCRREGAVEVTGREFEIDIDIEPPAKGNMGTYTVKQETGKRLQVSGPFIMPWRFVAIRLR